MQNREKNAPSGSTRLLLGTLLAALLLLRSPGSLLHPQFWAEDGTLFFQDAFNLGFLATILQPASGYLHTFPRLAAGLSLLFPMEAAPLLFNLAAFAAQLLPALYLLSPRMSHLLPALPARGAAALLLVSLPATYETHVNVTNSHWHLTLAAVCILLARPATQKLVRALETLVAVLFSLTGPFSVLFLPLVATRLFKTLKGALPVRDQTVPLAIAAGAVIQLAFAAASPRIGATVPFEPLSLRELATVISMHAFFNPVFGIGGVERFYRAVPPFAYGLGLCAIVLFAFVAVRDRVKPLLILFYLAAFSIALSFLFPLNDPKIWLHPRAGPRYFLFSCIFVHFSILYLAFAARGLKALGSVLLAAAVGFGVTADFFLPAHPDVHWADNTAVFRSLPAGSSFYVPVVPLYHGGMLLQKRPAEREPSPLSRLRPVPSPTPSSFSIGRPATVGLNRAENDRYFGVTGWAIDGASREPAGGVFVIVDDRVFPAVYGLPTAGGSDGPSCSDCGFSRLIPVGEIGPGLHSLSIAVITRDGTGYYQPAAPRTFATGDYFP